MSIVSEYPIGARNYVIMPQRPIEREAGDKGENGKRGLFLNPFVALFGAAGGAATGRSAASTGGAGSALKLSADGKGEGGHYSMNLFALAFWTSNLF
jgi:hypothetical protein